MKQLLRRKIVVLDGAMGTELIARGHKGALEQLNREAVTVVESLHEEYLKAGADIITTNTTCADAAAAFRGWEQIRFSPAGGTGTARPGAFPWERYKP